MSAYKYPRGELLWTGYYNKRGELLFLMTSKPTREYYFLYQLVDGDFKRLGRSKDPTELEKKFNVDEKMKG